MRSLVLVVTLAAAFGQVPPPPSPLPAGGSKEFGACHACRQMIASFKNGMRATARGKFEGGDAAWEEEKLRSYARSEVRLVEIQEKLCTDLKEGKDRCHAMAESAEHLFESWWTESDPEADDPFDYVCVEGLEHCCPIRHFGKDCTPCAGFPNPPCSGNGKCKGDGTRKGNGECLCDLGYSGSECGECARRYYESYRDDSKLLCSACHRACGGECSGPGPKDCEVCNEGWRMDTERGCTDIDECLEDPCGKNAFCANGDGSYRCAPCDRSCDGCTGDGPDMCVRCADGYLLKDEMCIDQNTVETSRKVTAARYLTYFGMCVTICIIFQKSTLLAGLLGLSVALYITVSEYMLAEESAISHATIDPADLDLAKLLEKAS